MGIVYQTDSRSGITYAYENKAFWDPELKRSRSKRKLIGRVDKETGEIVPTDGRCKKRSPSYQGVKSANGIPTAIRAMMTGIRCLKLWQRCVQKSDGFSRRMQH